MRLAVYEGDAHSCQFEHRLLSARKFILSRKLTPDEVAEWLRRWTANPICSSRVGSNPTLVVSVISIFRESTASAKRFAEMVNILFSLLLNVKYI